MRGLVRSSVSCFLLFPRRLRDLPRTDKLTLTTPPNACLLDVFGESSLIGSRGQVCVHASTEQVVTQLQHMGVGQIPVPPVNIPIPTKIPTKMGGAPTNQNGIPLVLTHSHISEVFFSLALGPIDVVAPLNRQRHLVADLLARKLAARQPGF